MKYLAGIVVTWLIRCEAVEESRRELYEYAVHCLLLGMAPLLYAVLIGGLMGEIPAGIVLILPFMCIRKFSGGFHAKNEWTCLVSSCLLLYSCIWMALHIQHTAFFNGIVLAAVFSLSMFSPVDSENRRLDKEEKRERKKETVILTLIFFVIYTVLLFMEWEKYAVCMGMGILLTAGLQIPCFLKNISKKH